MGLIPNMNIPSEEELVDRNDINAPYVCGWFLGKSADEAYEMFRSDSDGGGRDFWPGGFEAFANLSVRGLEYYLPPAIRYVQSRESAGNGDFVRGLLSSVSTHLYNEPIRRVWSPQLPPNALPPAVVDSIRELAEYVRINLEKFGLHEGDLATAMLEIKAVPPQ
jgi:hypothetical protein